MEQKIPQAFISAQSILAALSDAEIDKLCDISIKKRKRAVDTILSKVQMGEKESHGDTLQSIPLAMLKEGRFMEAANFITISIERGGYFDIRVIIEVMQNLGISMQISIEQGEDESAHVLREVLYGFCDYILEREEYKSYPIIYISVGSVFEGEGKRDNAIQAYNKALELGSIDAYICLTNIYEKSGKYTESAQLLKKAYDVTKDDKFLQGYISALSKSGERQKAYQHYTELLKKCTRPVLQAITVDSRPIIVPASELPPFIVFTEEVHSDADLIEFSTLFTTYYIDGTFLPNPQLRNLAENASIYISNEIEGIDKSLRELMMTPREGWTDEQIGLHRGLVKRRLHHMQTHIIILQDHRYLDEYLHDMDMIAINGNKEDHKILGEFFIEYFNPYTQAAYDHVSEDQGENTEKMDIFGVLRLHLVHIKAIFSQGTLYEDIRDSVEPLIDKCLEHDGNIEDEISIGESSDIFHRSDSDDTDSPEFTTQSDIREDPDIMELRKESKNYEALSASTMDMYEKYVGFLDAKYGMFYRRSMQQLVRDMAAIPPSAMGELKASLIKHNGDKERAFMEVIHNMPILLEDTYIALFFFIEKILLGHDILEEGQDIDDWIMKYRFDTLGTDDALLLTSMLYENSYLDYAIQYAINIPGMLQKPQALYMIMEHLLYMDNDSLDEDSTQEDKANMSEVQSDIGEDIQDPTAVTQGDEADQSQKLINVLNSICKREYDIDDFFEYFEGFMQNVLEDDDATDLDIGYTLIASGNMRCILEQSEDETIAEFVTAGEYGITYGYISAADMLQENGEYSKALQYFLTAHQFAPSIITIRRLAILYMENRDFKEAWSLLDDSTRDGYDVIGYMSACYLFEGKIREALREFSKILLSSGDIDFAFPESYEEEIAKRIKIELDTPIASIGDFETTIVGSYIFAERMSSDTNDYLNHVRGIIKLLDTYSLADASDMIVKTIPMLTGTIVLPGNISTTEIALIYLQLHLERIHSTIIKHYKSELLKSENITNESTLKILKLLNAFMITAIFIVKYFPDSQKYITTWQRAMNFYPTDEYQPTPDQYIHVMPSAIQ